MASLFLFSLLKVQAQVISYEAEDAILTGTNINIQSCGDCSGGEQIGGIESGNFFTREVTVAYAGQYTMTLSFSSGDARSIFVSVNGDDEMEVVCFSGDWGVVWTRQIELYLNAGTNTIRFSNESGFGPNIDKFTLEKNFTPAKSYEIENGITGGNAEVQSCSACSGANQVGNIGDNDGTLTSEVVVSEAGDYIMTLSYSSGDPRSVFISANGEEPVEIIGYTEVWGVIGTKEVSLSLKEGTNSILFYNERGFAPNLDKFTLEPDPLSRSSYEAEAGALIGTSAIQQCDACSGGQQVGNIDSNGSFSVEVTAADAGPHLMKLSFSSGDPRSVYISVNDGDTLEVSCYSGYWGIVESVNVPLMLVDGSNTIHFFNDVGFGPNIDNFELAFDPDPIPYYEAEEGVLSGNADIQQCGSCSGGAKVGNLGGEGSNNGELSMDINVMRGGPYTMALRYESGDPRSIFISVNNGEGIELICDSGEWGTDATMEAALTLNPGISTIRFFNDGNYGPNIDRFGLYINEDIEAPSDFTAEVSTVSHNSVELVLNATDESLSVIYEISYKEVIETINASSGVKTTFTAENLEPETAYTFSISAMDAAGNVASISPIEVIATTLEEPDVSAPTGFTADTGEITESSVQLFLNATDDSGEITYEINYNAITEMFTYNSGMEAKFTVESLEPETAYIFSISAMDAAGNVASNSPIEVRATTLEEPDTTAPIGFSALAGEVTESSVELLLTAEDDSGDVTFQITYNSISEIRTATSGQEISFIVGDLTPNTSYSFSVSVSDTSGNEALNSPLTVNARTAEVLSLVSRSDILIYPNPATNTLFIQWSDFELVTIYNLSGEKLMVSKERSISLESFVNGVYLVEVSAQSGELFRTRLIKD